MNKILLIIVAVLFLVIGFFIGKNTTKDTIKNQEVVSDENYEPMLREFSLATTDFSFGLKEIRARKGDTIKLLITNNGGIHSFKINEFSINIGEIKEGETKVVEFLADKVGTFTYYCGEGDHRNLGMEGKLIID